MLGYAPSRLTQPTVRASHSDDLPAALVDYGNDLGLRRPSDRVAPERARQRAPRFQPKRASIVLSEPKTAHGAQRLSATSHSLTRASCCAGLPCWCGRTE
jgi:hypothetical protein